MNNDRIGGSADATPQFVSPFLNFDPALINAGQSDGGQFIFAEGGAGGRGRFERAFSAIGGCVLGGVGLGSARGLYSGVTDAQMRQLGSASLKRSHLLNHVVRNGGSLAQTAGCIGLFYGVYDFALYKLRDEVDDNANTMAACTLTGFTYKLPSLFNAGLAKGVGGFVRGGVAGAVVGAALAAFSSGESARHLLGGD